MPQPVSDHSHMREKEENHRFGGMTQAGRFCAMFPQSATLGTVDDKPAKLWDLGTGLHSADMRTIVIVHHAAPDLGTSSTSSRPPA